MKIWQRIKKRIALEIAVSILGPEIVFLLLIGFTPEEIMRELFE